MSLRLVCSLALLAWVASCTCSPRSPASSAAASATAAARHDDPARASGAATKRLTEAEARHLLLRASFGPAVGEVQALAGKELGAWLDEQLTPAPPEPELELALAPYRAVFDAPGAVAAHFPKPHMGEAKDDRGEEDDPRETNGKEKLAPIDRGDLLQVLQMAELTRHILSRRQLREVMADFWINHFNVEATQRFLAVAPAYLEGIRERALGRFEGLLSFTAHHPAMLLYLDNAKSVALPPKAAVNRPFRGLNENYARELLELHTLGVNGGYTQADVREVARVFTGWGIAEPQPYALEFAFHENRHDHAPKVVLGQTIEPAGEAEGQRVLALLAKHPSTARHLATKLCRRFVADDPPPACVEVVSRAYSESDGDIARTLRALFESDSFWDPSVRARKLKSPLEFIVSAARVLGVTPDGSTKLARQLSRMGEGLMLFPAPTGYPERMDEWLTSGALHSRLELSVLLVRAQGIGLEGDPVGLFEGKDDLAGQAEAFIVGAAAPATRRAVEEALARIDKPRQRRVLALSLYLGSPEFQRQ